MKSSIHIRQGAMIVASIVLLTPAGISLWTQAGALGSASVSGLSKIVMPAPKGLVSDSVSLSGGPTGNIAFSEATSSDCNVSSSLKKEWLASQLRYYVSSRQKPQKYLLLCVTLMRTTSAALANVRKVADASKMAPLSLISGARTTRVGPTTLVVFSIDSYFVFIAGLDLSAGSSVHLVDAFASAQFNRASK